MEESVNQANASKLLAGNMITIFVERVIDDRCFVYDRVEEKNGCNRSLFTNYSRSGLTSKLSLVRGAPDKLMNGE